MSESIVKSSKQLITGIVTSDIRHKTIAVKVARVVKHPLLGKYFTRYTTYHVHDEHNSAKIGDQVAIMPQRPISKTKFCRLAEIYPKKN